MASLEELLNTGLGGILEGGGSALEESLYQRQAQSEKESTFGRGLGISTVTRDSLAKARVDASLAAQNAQLAALGQAAGITQGNANRTQQASQFGANMNQRNKELGQQESLANKQMLASGLGAGAGAALNIAGMAYRPQIQDLLGVRGGAGAGGANGVPGGQMPGAGPTAMPTFDAGAGSGGGMPDLSALGGGDFSMPSTSFGSGDLNFGGDFDFGGGFGGFDLGGLFDYDPYQWGDYM